MLEPLRIHILQGEHQVSSDPAVVLTTTLGSCVSACLRDAGSGVGGMNHFLLPDGDHQAHDEAEAARYGAYAMEKLINALLARGARRNHLSAKLFGGGRLLNRLVDIGSENVAFAERFLAQEGIPVEGGSVRGDHARRIEFWPVSGRVRQLAVGGSQGAVFDRERQRPAVEPADYGSVELF